MNIEKVDEQRVRFTISYDAKGSGFEQHEISAEVLAKSILGMNQVIKTANLMLNGKDKEIELVVTAPVKEGSVLIEFALNYLSDYKTIVDVTKYIGLTAASSVIFGGTLIELIKKFGDKPIEKIELIESTNSVKVKVEGSPEFEVDKNVYEMINDSTIRKSLNEVIYAPISNKTESVFSVESDGVLINKIEKDEKEFFSFDEKKLEVIKTELVEAEVRFSTVNFTSKKGWKILWNKNTISTVIEDNGFMDQISKSAEKFSKDDLFNVTMKVEETKNPFGKSKFDYTIIKVNRHRVDDDKKLI